MEIYLNDNRELKEGILNDIRNTDDICSYIDAAIKELKGVVKKFNPSENFLGVNVPLNKKFDLENNDNYLIGNFYWYSFIDSDVKVIYGFSIDENSSVCNDGLYYYIDDNEYLYDFARFIKDKEIGNDFDFLCYVKEFLDNYFNDISNVNLLSREERNKTFINSNGKNINPIKRSNRGFYQSNIAMCTEYATMGLNILGVFGYSSLVLIGSLDFDKEEIGHAYNIVAMDNGVYLVDMASSVIVTDLDGNLLDEVPFYKELTEEELQNILDKKEPISLNNVFYIYFGENNFKFEEDRQRTYRVSNMVLKDSFKNKKKSRGINNFYNI